VKNPLKLLILILGLFAANTAKAQNYETTLTGTVQDTTGAIVSNALITIVNVDTNATRKTRTTGTGSYYVGSLPIGHYNVKVSAENFGTSEIKDIELVVGQTRQLDVRLNIGAVVQEVKVEDNEPALQTTTAEIGAVVQNQQIKDLPLNGRNVASLLALVPGAIDSGGGTLSTIRFAGRVTTTQTFAWTGSMRPASAHRIPTQPCGWSPPLSRSRNSKSRRCSMVRIRVEQPEARSNLSRSPARMSFTAASSISFATIGSIPMDPSTRRPHPLS
jgi:hypothetical protein